MYIKRFLLINTMALSLFGASIASAQTSVHPVTASLNKTEHSREHMGKILTPQQRVELVKIKKNLCAQLVPLKKERHAINMRIRGKIATPGTKWSDLSPLIAKRNAINEKISSLLTKTQLETYQKLGIMLPHHKHHGCASNNKFVKQ